MPNIVANKKHLRKSKKRFIRNKAIKSRVNNFYKKIINFFSGKEKVDNLDQQVSHFYKIADKAALKGVFKKNTIARKKSKLAKTMFLAKQKKD